jgi:hypothetical protein
MTMIKTKLAKAVSMAIAGAALSAGASSAFASNTMYNTWDAGLAPGVVSNSAQQTTDGWTHTNGNLNSDALNPWYGTSTLDPRPFGYTGSAALSWAVNLTSASDSGIISAADATTRYGSTSGYLAPDVDTAKGAWEDAPATGTPTGWRHAVDFGLIESDVTTTIRLTPSTIDNTFANNFGISLYQGMDTNTGSWSHHGGWHSGYVAGDTSAANLAKVNGNNPVGTSGLTFLDFMDSSGLGPNGGHYLEFTALAGQVYTVILGGRDGGNSWSSPQAGYSLNVTAVPVPGAVWLFGSAFASFAGLCRRNVTV